MNVATAFTIANRERTGQLDKQNIPYIHHCVGVMARFIREFPQDVTDDALCVCLLHDLYEDTKFRLDDTQHHVIHSGIRALRHLNTQESYAEYIDRICSGDPILKKIKLCDLFENWIDCPVPSLKTRYFKAIVKVSASIAEPRPI